MPSPSSLPFANASSLPSRRGDTSSMRKRSQKLVLWFKTNKLLIAVFVSGIMVGVVLKDAVSSSTNPISLIHRTKPTGSVVHLQNVPFRDTSHTDQSGKFIQKQQLLEPFVVPHLTGFSVATFQIGQSIMPAHLHESMHEFFYILEGNGIVHIDGFDHPVHPGTFLHIAPKESHGIWVPKNSQQELKVAIFGITTNDK